MDGRATARRRAAARALSVSILLCCVSTCVSGIPLLFPSVDEFTSLVYDEATQALLPVQAAFPFFLCSAAGETVELEAANQACGGKVIYTKNNTFSLTLLSLSDLGVLQPIPDAEVEVDTSAKVDLKDFGVGGLIPGGEVLSVVTDAVPLNPVPTGRRLLQLPGGTTDPIGGVAVPDTSTAVGDTVGAATGAVEETTSPAVGAVGETAANLTETGEAAASDLTEAGATAAESGAGTTADLVEGATDAANDTAAGVVDTGAAAAETGVDAIGEGASLAEEAAEGVVETTSGVIEAGSEAADALIATGQGFVETTQGLVLDLADFNLTKSLENATLIPDGLSFMMEVEVTELPANQVTKVKVTSGGSTREVYIFFDESPPSPSLAPSDNQKRLANGAKEAEVKFEISFTERIIPFTATEVLECNPLDSRFSDVLSPDLLTEPEAILSLLEVGTSIATDLVDAAGECGVDPTSGGLLNFDPSDLFTINGALNSVAEYIAPEFNLNDLGTKLSGGAIPKVVVTATFDPNDTSTVIDLETGEGAIMDFAALLNLDGFLESFPWNLMMEWLQAGQLLAEDVIQRGKNLGTAATTIVASTIAGSVATSVGVTVAGSVGGSVAGSGATAAGGTMSGAVDLLNVGQKVFLTGQLAVGNMPENFQAFADQLKWTMFDIKLPWDDDDDKETGPQPSQGRRKLKMLSVLEDKAEEFVSDSDSDDPRDLVKRSFFWIALFFMVLLIIHLSITVVLMLRRIKVPPILRFPRLELYFMYWAIPAIATSSAGLFKGDTSDKVLGAFLIVLFPFTFLAWHLYVLRKHFYSRTLETCKAALVYESMDSDKSGKEVAASVEKEEEVEEPATGCIGFLKRCYAKFDALMEVLVYTPFLGAPYDEGTWVAPTGPKSMFFNRFGAMFQDFRHQPSIRSNITYLYDESKGVYNRGEVQAVEAKKGLENTRIGHIIQISGKVLEVAKLIFVAMLISGEDDPSSNAQAIILLILTIAYAVLLRIFRPPLARWDLGMAMVGEVGDMLTYVFAIMIINNDDSDEPDYMEAMGIALLCFQGISFLATFLDNFFVLVDAGKAAYEACKNGNQEPPKLLGIALKAQLNNARYLERKYYNRWVTRTLGKGVHTGSVKHAPLEEVVFGYTKKSGKRSGRGKEGGASGKIKAQSQSGDMKDGGKEGKE